MENVRTSLERVEGYLRTQGAPHEVLNSLDILKGFYSSHSSGPCTRSVSPRLTGNKESNSGPYARVDPSSSSRSGSFQFNSSQENLYSVTEGSSSSQKFYSASDEEKIAAVFSPSPHASFDREEKAGAVFGAADQHEKQRELKKLLTFSNNIKLYNLMSTKQNSFGLGMVEESAESSTPENTSPTNRSSFNSFPFSPQQSLSQSDERPEVKEGWAIGPSRRNTPVTGMMVNEQVAQIGNNWHLDILELSNTPIFLKYGPIFVVGKTLLAPIGDRIHRNFNELVCPVLNDIQNIYLPNPYHNALHGATVGHMCKVLSNIVTKRRRLKPLEEFTLVISSLAHDTGHPGLTNNFLNVTYNPISLIYNDASTLENYHCSLLFHILRYNSSFFDLIPLKEWSWIRRRIIQLILSTDMSTHFFHIDNLKNKRMTSSFSFEKDDDYWFLLILCIKAADIGHNFLPWVDHLPWTCALFDEFYAQGDAEKQLDLPHLSLFDRDRAEEVPHSQVSFFSIYLNPLLIELKTFDEDNLMELLFSNSEANVAHWETHSGQSVWDLLRALEDSELAHPVPDLFTLR